jgi:hypothetical protein
MNPGRKAMAVPVAGAVLTVAVAVILGLAPSAEAASFVPLAQFDCGAAGTFFSEVMPIRHLFHRPWPPPSRRRCACLRLKAARRTP